MAELICFFTFPERNNESNYFIVESTITLHQLQNFLLTSKIIDESFTIETASNEALSEENLAALIAEAVSSDSPLQIVLKAKSTGSQPAEESPAQKEVPKAKEPIGPTMRSILEKIGVKFDESILNDVQKCLGSLPFPYSFLFKQYLDQIMANPNILQSTVQQIAQMFSVDEKTLLDEVNVAIDFIKNPPAPEPVVQQAEAEVPAAKMEEAAPQPLVGPILAQLLKERFGIEEASLYSREDIQNIVNRLPFFRILLSCVENPNIVHSFANGLAYRFSVDREKVTEELKQFGELLRSTQPQPSAEANPPVPGLRMNRRGRCNRWRTNNFHPATCDSCKSMISGVRYYCLHCKNFDLCSACEQKNTDAPFHDETHIFAKIKNPATPYRIDELIKPNAGAPPHCFSGESQPATEAAKPDSAPNHRAHPRFRCAFPVPNEQSNGTQPEDHPWFKRFSQRAEAKNRMDQLEASVKQLKETISQLQNGN